MSTVTTTSGLQTESPTTVSSTTSFNSTSTTGHPTSSDAVSASQSPGASPPPQPNLIFGFVIAVLLIFMIVMGGGMTARLYSDQQRRARRATESARLERTADVARPPMNEVWVPREKEDMLDTPGHTWSAIRPLSARMLGPNAPAAAAAEPVAEEPIRELYVGHIGGRGGALPLLVPLSKRQAATADPALSTLQTAVVVRMPTPGNRTAGAQHSEIDAHGPREEEHIPVLEIGTCAVLWRADSLL